MWKNEVSFKILSCFSSLLLNFIKSHHNVSADYNLMLRVKSTNYNLKKCSLASLLYSSVLEVFDLDYPMKTSLWTTRCSLNELIHISNNREKHFCQRNPSIRKQRKFPNFTNNIRDAIKFNYDLRMMVFMMTIRYWQVFTILGILEKHSFPLRFGTII